MTPRGRRAGVRLGLAGALAITASSVAPGAWAAAPIAGILPVAVDDAVSTVHGRVRTVADPGVLANDLQLGGGFTAELVSGTSHGKVDLDPKGGYTYRSDDDYVGSDQFRYRVDGGLLGLSNIATVRITVTNHAPVAQPDAYTAVADVDRSIPAPGVLGNDDDKDGDALTIDVVSEPAHGNLDEHDDGSFKYKADKDFAGTDTFTYRVWDGVAWSATVKVVIDVTGPTPKPTTGPTPTSTPRPTAAPTGTPTPTAATPHPAATPTAEATGTPPPTPASSVRPTPSPRPTGRPGPTPSPTPEAALPTPAATGAPSPSPNPTATEQPSRPPSGAGTIGAGGTTGGGDASGGSTTGGGADTPGLGAVPGSSAHRPIDAFTVAAGPGTDLRIDPTGLAFGSFEWAVPALVLTVPGLLLILAVLAQATIGLAFLPVARRWLGDDRRRRSRPQPASRR